MLTTTHLRLITSAAGAWWNLVEGKINTEHSICCNSNVCLMQR